MFVFGRRIGHGPPIKTARNHHGQFELQRQALLEHTGHAAKSAFTLEGGHRLAAIGHPRLTLAVVAQPRDFQDGRKKCLIGIEQVIARRHLAVGRNLDATASNEALFSNTVLRDRNSRRRRTHRDITRQTLERCGRHILELGGGCAAQAGELIERSRIEIVGLNMPIGHRTRRAVGTRIEHADPIAQALRGHAEHAPELTTAEQAQP